VQALDDFVVAGAVEVDEAVALDLDRLVTS